MAVLTHNESYSLAAVEDSASVSDDSVYKFAALTYLCGCFFAASDCKVLELCCALDVAVWSQFYILDDSRSLDYCALSNLSVDSALRGNGCKRHLLEGIFEPCVFRVVCPEEGVGHLHVFERKDAAVAVFIHYHQLCQDRRIFTLLQNSVSELCMVCTLKFVDSEEHAKVTDNVVAHEGNPVHGTVVSDI